MRQKCGGFAAQRIICWPSLPHVQDVPPRQPDGLVLRYLQRHHGSRVTCRLAQCDSNQIQWSGKGYTRQYTGHHQPERPKPRCTHTCDNLVLALLVLVVAERGGGDTTMRPCRLPFPSPHPHTRGPDSPTLIVFRRRGSRQPCYRQEIVSVGMDPHLKTRLIIRLSALSKMKIRDG